MKRDAKGQPEPRSALLARRSFLKAVGSAATVLPFYKMLEDSVAHAQSGQLPLKFVGVGAFHGTTQKFYARQAGETDDVFDISYADSCLRPFDQAAVYGHSFRNQVNIFEGFDYGVARVPNFTYSDGSVGEIDLPMHGCMGFLLTGSASTDAAYINDLDHPLQNPSLDQYLAGLYGGSTRFRSLELKVEDDEAISALNIAAGPGGAILSTMTSPADLWDKCFASLMAPTGSAAQAAAAQKAARGKSILDFVLGDLQRLDVRLGTTEKQKLDQHLTVVRDLERQLQTTMAPMGTTCTAPVRHAPTGNANPADDYLIGSSSNAGIVDLDRVANMQIELLAQILICDMTRFATIVLPNFGGAITGAPYIPSLVDPSTMLTASTVTDIPVPADFHLEIAHHTDDGDVNSVSLAIHQAVAAVQRYYHGKVARLMQRLQDAGVLDNTVILIGNEGGAGWHTLRSVPIVMAGGANGAIRMGRRIVSPGRVARVGDYTTMTNGGSSNDTRNLPTSHNPILIAIANAFHTAAGNPVIDSYGTCTLHPGFTQGIQGLL
jgi:hypothetical protein